MPSCLPGTSATAAASGGIGAPRPRQRDPLLQCRAFGIARCRPLPSPTTAPPPGWPPAEETAIRHDEVYKSIFSHSVSVEHLLRFVAGMIDEGPEWLAAFDSETLEPVPT